MLVVTLIGFLLIGPYSYLAGAISLDFGGKQGSSTASGFIDGIGYLGGMMAGDSMARIVVRLGWKGAFLVLGGVAHPVHRGRGALPDRATTAAARAVPLTDSV